MLKRHRLSLATSIATLTIKLLILSTFLFLVKPTAYSLIYIKLFLTIIFIAATVIP